MSGNYCVAATANGCTSQQSCTNVIVDISQQAEISITSQNIPSWQRENDDLVGSITANYSNMLVGANIQLDIYVNGIYAGTPSLTTWATNSSNGTHQFNFVVSASSLNPKPLQGDQVGYQLINYTSSAHDDALLFTSIIEKKWDKKNVAIYNENGEQLSIPLKHVPNCTQVQVTICRDGGDISGSGNQFSLVIPLDNIRRLTGANSCGIPQQVYCILNNPNNSFCQYISNTGYFSINVGNDNNLKSVPPGELKYHVFYLNSSSQVIPNTSEDGYFELTKVGKINYNGRNKAVVFIGGWNSDIYGDINSVSDGSDNSRQNWSITKNSRWSTSGYDTYYISQNNIGYTQRNAYEIGIALDKLLERNPQITELSLVCHSKAGLEARALLGNFAVSYSDFPTPFYNFASQTTLFSSFQCANKVKKVAFLATPHNGISLGNTMIGVVAMYAGFAYAGFRSSPAYKELLRYFDYDFIGLLNTYGKIPLGIQIANLTCYRSDISNSLFYNYHNYVNEFTDGVVIGWSSDGIYLTYTNNSPVYVKQMFQESPNFICHSDVVTNRGLNLVSSTTHANINCIPPNSSNLDKLVTFITGNHQTYNYTIPFTSCVEPSMNSFSSQTFASVLTGALISRKLIGDTVFYPLGITDEHGQFNSTLIPAIQSGDSLKIEAPGFETLVFVVDTEIIGTNKIPTSVFKKPISTNKVQYPILKLINQTSITTNNTILVEATGRNIVSYKVNSPFNQDTTFVSLNLNNNQFVANLDTGYNQILVRFIGQQDSVTLSKEIYYFPPSSLSLNTYNLSLSADSSTIGAKLYVNNQFVKSINSLNESIPVLIGRNFVKLSKFGYTGSVITVDSAASINASLNLFPHSYSSLNDSSLIHFNIQGKIHYRKNVTVMDSALQSSISIKQYDDSFSAMRLIPKSRKFEFRHLNSFWSNIRFAAILDQFENLHKDSIYLLRVYDDNSFMKLPFDSTSSSITTYDSLVQKLTFDYINFNNGTVVKEALVLMKKQPPIVNSVSSYNVNENDSLIIPLLQFFSDPDSIHNDMLMQLVSSTPQLNARIIGNSLIIKPTVCWNGSGTFTLQAQHDFLLRSNSASVTVNPRLLPTITGSTVLNCIEDTLTLTAHSSITGTTYNWGGGTSAATNIVSSAGTYTVIITDTTNGCTASASEAVSQNIVTPNVSIAPPGQLTCSLSSVTLYASSTTQGVSYNWGGGVTTSSYSVNAPGTYKVTVTNPANGCLDSASVTVNQGGVIPNIIILPPAVLNCTVSSVVLTAVSSTQGAAFDWGSGNTTTTKVVNTSGTYSVTVTNPVNGCRASASTYVSSDNSHPNAFIYPPGMLSCVQPTVPLIASSNISGVTYNWGGGITEAIDTVNSPGFYTVTVTDPSNGCSASASVVVTQDINVPNVNIPPTADITCTVLSVPLVASSTTPGAIYDWGGGITTSTYIANGPGTYSVTVTDPSSGCAATAYTIVFQSGVILDVSIAPTTILNCLINSVTLIASSTTPGVTYDWGGGVTTNFLTVNSPGSYSVTITDPSTGCMSSTAAIVSANHNIPIVSIATPSPLTCRDTTIILRASSNGTGITYKWSSPTSTGPTKIVSAPRTYHVTATDAVSKCTASASVIVVQDTSSPSVSVSAPSSICFGEIASLTASGGTTYTWSNSSTASTITIIPSVTSSYMVTVTGSNGCKSIASPVTITVNSLPPMPVISTTGATTFCQGNSVLLTSSVSNSYLWSNSAISQGITVLSSGDYTVTITDSNGCSAVSNPITVSVIPSPAIPIITVNGSTTFCQGNSVILNVGSSNSYLWSNSAITQDITVSNSGNYTVTITDNNGCSAGSLPIVITVNPLPSVPSIIANGPTTFCHGNSVILSASLSNSYLWSNSAVTKDISISNSGSYTVTITDSSGCSVGSLPTIVIVNPLPIALISASGVTTFCQGDSVILSASLSDSYLWSNSATSQDITVSSSGNYTVTIADVNGCSASSSPVAITANLLPPIPIITASGSTIFCHGDSLMLTTSSVTNYLWSTNQTTQSISVSTPGNYSLTITDANDCSNSSLPMTVTVSPLPVVSLPPFSNVPYNTAIFLLGGGTPSGGTYSGDGVVGEYFDPSITGVGTFIITYSHIDSNGCNGYDTSSITVEPPLTEIYEAGNNLFISIFPNPNSGVFTVMLKADNVKQIEIACINVIGEEIYEKYFELNNGELRTEINLAPIGKGLYLIRLIANGKPIYRKVIITE